MLQTALAEAAGRPIPAPIAAASHRWRYALSAGTGDGALWNAELKLGACGDCLLGPRVEFAWLSGRMLAESCNGLTSANPAVGGGPGLNHPAKARLLRSAATLNLPYY